MELKLEQLGIQLLPAPEILQVVELIMLWTVNMPPKLKLVVKQSKQLTLIEVSLQPPNEKPLVDQS